MTNSRDPYDHGRGPAVHAVDPVERDVRRCLEHDEGFAADTLKSFAGTKQVAIEDIFLRFFPHLKHIPGCHWSNLPSGIKLAHYLLVGGTPILDLEPLSPEQFEARHGLSISATEALVSDGRVLANLYVRDPKKWHGMNHYRGLLAKSVVNGVRVDHCLSALNPSFERTHAETGLKAERAEQFARAMAAAPPDQRSQLMQLNPGLTEDEIPRIEGHRWAYLDVLKPDASATVDMLVTDGLLVTAVEFLRLVKRAYISPYTASLSGTCVWGPADNDRWLRLRASGLLQGTLLQEKRWSDLENILKRSPATLQLIVDELARTPAVGLVTKPCSEKIVELQRRTEWQNTKHTILDLLRDITRLARADGYEPGKVEELHRWLDEQRKLLRAFQLGGSLAGEGTGWGIAGVLGFGVGTLFAARVGVTTGGVIGTVLGGLAGVPLGTAGKKVGTLLGDWGHEMARPEQHRVIAKLDAVTLSAATQ